MTITLSEIDFPPEWRDLHWLRATATGCMLTDAEPGYFEVWLDQPRLEEMIDAWMIGPSEDFVGVGVRADLAEAVDDFIAECPQREHLFDWALHLEMLAARLRESLGTLEVDR